MSADGPRGPGPPPGCGPTRPPSRADAIGEPTSPPARRTRKLRVEQFIHRRTLRTWLGWGSFRLPLVLVPTERVPLHIFEPRYRELIGECIERDEEFGILLKTRTAEARGGRHARGGRARSCSGCPTGGCTSRSRAASVPAARAAPRPLVPRGHRPRPVDGRGRSARRATTSRRSHELFGRLQQTVGSTVEPPAADVAAARLRDRRAGRLRQRREAGAARAHLAAPPVRAARRSCSSMRWRRSRSSGRVHAVGGVERQGHAAQRQTDAQTSCFAIRMASTKRAVRAAVVRACGSPRARSRASRRARSRARCAGRRAARACVTPARARPLLGGARAARGRCRGGGARRRP